MNGPLKHSILLCSVLTASCHRRDEQAETNTYRDGVIVVKGQPISSTSDVVTVAGQLLNARGLAWGEPVEVMWQEDMKRYLLLYATPEKEKTEVGDRGVFVMTNGHAIVMPQM